MSDVRDILDIEQLPDPVISKDSILGLNNDRLKKSKKRSLDAAFKRPEGMHRELYALLYSDNKETPPIISTDTANLGYQQMKAKLGMRKVRPWKWMPFTNPARKDGFVLHHWRRIADEGKDYPFAKFNKEVQVTSYTDFEYQQLLQNDQWTRAETDHLFDLCTRFDLRFIIIQDRWDTSTYAKRSVEDLKERYYDICNQLAKTRTTQGHDIKMKVFDVEHERKRKEQLRRLFERTPEQMDEEQVLITELRKIELRKKEREKKTQDLQKLITAADSQMDQTWGTRTPGAVDNRDKKSNQSQKTVKKLTGAAQKSHQKAACEVTLETTGIRFPDFKASGVSLRSQRMKLPTAVGQKKTKAIEQLLHELNVDVLPIPTEEIAQNFNEMRSDMVLLYELKLALSNCEYELQSLRHQYEVLAPGKNLDVSVTTAVGSTSLSETIAVSVEDSPTKVEATDLMDTSVTESPGTLVMT